MQIHTRWALMGVLACTQVIAAQSPVVEERQPPGLGPDGSVSSPSSYLGGSVRSDGAFGRLVDRSGDLLIIADDTTVSLYDTSTDTFLAEDFGELSDVDLILSVAIEDDVVALTYRTGSLDVRLGIYTTAGTGTYSEGSLPAPSWVKVHDGVAHLFGGLQVRALSPVGEDLGSVSLPQEPFPATTEQVFWAGAVGDGTSGCDTVMTTTWSSLSQTLTVHGLGYCTGYDYFYIDVVAASPLLVFEPEPDFGVALAVDDRRLAVGDWGNDELLLYREVGFGFSPNGSVDVRSGVEIAMDGDLLAYSQRYAELLPGGGLDVGAVHLLRYVNTELAWCETGEIHHAGDVVDGAAPEQFGASLALDGERLVVGEPGGAGQAWYRTLPDSSSLTRELVPGLAGFRSAVPCSEPSGATLPQAPFGIDLRHALPFGSAFLVLGFTDVSAPFKGGVLLPSLDLVTPLPIDGAGSFELEFFWFDMPGQAFTLYGPVWIPDASGPNGFASTPAWSARQDA